MSEFLWRRFDRLREEDRKMFAEARRLAEHRPFGMFRPSTWRAMRDHAAHAEKTIAAMLATCRDNGDD